MSATPNFFSFLLPNLPLILVWLVGIILASVRWRYHPRTSALAVVGMLLLLLTSMGGIFLSFLSVFIHTRGVPFSTAENMATIASLLLVFFQAAGWVLVLGSIFADRTYPPGRREKDQTSA